MSDDSRYEEILRRIQQRKAQEASQPKQDVLAGVLDGVNAMGVLEGVKKRPPAGQTCYGPRVYRKALTAELHVSNEQIGATLKDDSFWLGALVWHKPRGYGRYETLGVLGIWAVDDGSAIALVVGTKQLTFSAPVFNPESYQIHMRRGFNVYYAGEPSPPAADANSSDGVLYRTLYEVSKRLALRDAIEAAVQNWRETFSRS